MKRILTSLPIWIVLTDMAYGFFLNISQSLNLHQQARPLKDSLPVSPDIAFSGLQVLTNGGMILIIGFGLMVLLQLNRSVLQKQILPIGIFRTLGLLAVLAFSLPSLWEWFWAAINFAKGQYTIAFDNPRYLITAICLPLISCLCIVRLTGWYRLHKNLSQENNL